MKRELADKIIAEVTKVPVFYNHLKKQTIGYSGSVRISPITIWLQSIDFRMNVGNVAYFKRAIKKFRDEHKEFIDGVYFLKEGNVLVVRPKIELCND
jgi:hypothetical protein